MTRTFDLQNNDKGYVVDLMNDAIAMIEATDESDGPEDIDISLENVLEFLLLRYMSGRFITRQAELIQTDQTGGGGPPEAIDEVGEGPRRIREPLIAGPVDKSSFKINEGTAWALIHLAKGIIQEADDYLQEPEINGSSGLDQMSLAAFVFLWEIKKEDQGGG